MTEAVVTVQNLRKVYGTVVAVDDIDFQVQKGEIFGLLGPNGAGKTSTLECLEGIRRPDGGSLRILDVDPTRQPRHLHSLIGVQLQTSSLPANMTVDEALRFFSAYHGVAPPYDLLDRLGLGPKRDSQFGTLSAGQQRRLALALAVAHKPPVIILDEPTAGLDVGSRSVLHSLMQELRQEGTTILLATHDMAEAEKLSDRVAILLTGRVISTGTPRELTAAGSGYTKVSVRSDESVLLQANEAFPGVEKRMVQEDYAIFFTTNPGATVTAVLDHITARGDRLIDLRVERPTLEERFLELTETGGLR
jgi:ABC-2 type transport system ATP-binding protein